MDAFERSIMEVTAMSHMGFNFFFTGRINKDTFDNYVQF